MSFDQKSQLNTRLKMIHQQIKDHKCQDCNKLFSRKGDRDVHIKSVHQKLKCQDCNRNFSKKNT